jgi:hypothetical protein
MKALRSLLVMCVLMSSTARSVEPSPENVRVEMKIISLPRALALPLLTRLGEGGSADEAMAQLDETIRSGEGRLEAWLHAHPSAAVFPRSESGEEIRYALECAKAYIPGIRVSVRPPGGPAVPVMPTTIDPKSTGFTLEATAEVAPDGSSIEVRCTSKETVHAGWTRAAAAITPSGIAMSPPLPKSSRRLLAMSASVQNRRWLLAGTFLKNEGPPRVELRFLRATVIRSSQHP